jgi:hypothetical protein
VAIDRENGDLTDSIKTSDPVETEPETYTVTYTVKDRDEQPADPRTRTILVRKESTTTTTTTAPRTQPLGGLVIALTDNEDEREADGDIVYLVRFANLGNEDVAVTANLELPPGLSGRDTSQCDGSTCTMPELIIHPIGEIAPAIDELLSWTVVVDVADTAGTVIVATVTVEHEGIQLDEDQEPTLLRRDQ